MKSVKIIFKNCQIIIVVMVMSLLLMGATDGKKAAVQFDFKKTSEYTHDMDGRPDFPVSITLARNYVYSVLALGEKMDPKKQEKIVEFIKKLQRADGGFSIDLATPDTNALYTDFCLETLSFMNAVNSIDTAKAKSYIASLKRPDGGFSFDARTKDSSFQSTYVAVHALSYINGLDIADTQKTASYIKEFERNQSGGFNYVKGTGVPNVTNTYMAVFTLKTLGMLDDSMKKRTVEYLSSTGYTGTFKKYEVSQTLDEQAYAILALKVMGAADKIKKQKVISFIKSFYIPLNGGFGPLHGYGSAPDPTYFAIRGLAELGVLKTPNRT